MFREKLRARWREFKYTKSIPLSGISLPKINISRGGLSKILVGVSLVGALGILGYGGYKAAGCMGGIVEMISEGSLDDYLPEGFKGLEMGEGYNEVQRIRPFIKSGGEEGEARESIGKESMLNFSRMFFGDETVKDKYYRLYKDLGISEEELKYQVARVGGGKVAESAINGLSGLVNYTFINNKLTKIEFNLNGRDCNSYSLFSQFNEGAEDKLGKNHDKGDHLSSWDKGETKISLFTTGNTYYCHLNYVLEKIQIKVK